MQNIDPVISSRIRTNPVHDCIVEGSIPIVSFGDFRRASVATLGINPSKREFIYKTNPTNYFETLATLGASDHMSMTNDQVERALQSCFSYFEKDHYRSWFSKLENYILQKLSASYYDHSACHLDIIQSATDPVWRGLEKEIANEMFSSDIEFLHYQLENSPIKKLLINGKTASTKFIESIGNPPFLKHEILPGKPPCSIFKTQLELKNKTIEIYGWSNNLQSTIGLRNTMREEIGNWISKN